MLNTTTVQKIEGPADFYAAMLEVKNGGAKLALYKKEAKEVGVEWSFIEQAAAILGLGLVKSSNKHGAGSGFRLQVPRQAA
jgi:hypothetical protein